MLHTQLLAEADWRSLYEQKIKEFCPTVQQNTNCDMKDNPQILTRTDLCSHIFTSVKDNPQILTRTCVVIYLHR